MLARLRKRFARLGRKVTGWTNRIKQAQAIVADLTVRIDKLEPKLADVTAEADAARRKGNHEKAKKLDRRALDLVSKIGALKGKRRFWIGRVKQLRIEKKGFAAALADLEKRIAELDQKKIKIDIAGNKVTGGTAKERWIAACLTSAQRCSTGARPNFYSQPGTYTTDKCFTGERWTAEVKERSDCSQWVTSVARAAGLDDPNGTEFVGGGYTGTLVQAHGKWRETDRNTFLTRGWGYVVYGTGTGFHVEAFIGGTKTIGHGDSQINEGHLDMFSDRRYFIYG
jgi:hypothetical protein